MASYVRVRIHAKPARYVAPPVNGTVTLTGSTLSLDLTQPDFRCPDAPVLGAPVVDANGTRWAAAVVFPNSTDANRSCAVAVQCRYKYDSADLALMACDSMGIADVLSVPRDAKKLELGYNDLRALNLTAAPANGQLTDVVLTFNKIVDMDDVLLPPSVQSLTLAHNRISTLSLSHAFSNLTYLKVSYNPIVRVDVDASSALTTLEATDINLTRLHDLTLPDTITTLNIGYNPQMAFEHFTAPKKLQTFRADRSNITRLRSIDFTPATQLSTIDLTGNTIREIAGVKFPRGLQTLLLNGSDVSCFVLRESDVDVIRSLQWFNVSSLAHANCSDSDARDTEQRTVTIGGASYAFSILDDATFDTRFYVKQDASPASVSPDSQLSSQSSSSTVAVVAMLVLTVAILATIAWVLHTRRRYKSPTAFLDRTESGSDTESTLSTSTLRSGMSLDDIRDEEAFAATRIPQEDLVRSTLLGKGAFGVVYQATLRHETQVIVKQILPEKAKKPYAIQQFMDEIRLCAQLRHPKIVEFLGISWSSLADLGVVLEFMANGDLATLLHTEHTRERNRETFTWTLATSEATATRTNLEIAIDIAEALVCLHSFEPPIIHRDLKANNVLLSDAWVAKLSDFGVSRPVAETMTAEVRTVAWTAPEILRGTQYDEAADIYSFGVLMSELDTCEKPFAHELLLRSLDRDSTTSRQQDEVIQEPSSARIALAIVQHQAQPDFHDDCPPQILALALRCMAANPDERPTAIELREELESIAREENVSLRLATVSV